MKSGLTKTECGIEKNHRRILTSLDENLDENLDEFRREIKARFT